jgi:hypothetical protein
MYRYEIDYVLHARGGREMTNVLWAQAPRIANMPKRKNAFDAPLHLREENIARR